MNEIDLIREVEKHPILYDKTVRGFNKAKLRDDAWKQVEEALDVSESECKKRWRSLRDSFIKLQRTHGNRTRWPYHHAMKFLLPHLETYRQEINVSPTVKIEVEESDPEEENRQRPLAGLPEMTYTGELVRAYEDEEDNEPMKKMRLTSSDDENSCPCTRSDPDELFLLSCAPTFKRLSPKQNAIARLKIQQVLLESEFGSSAEQPFVTPVSDCGFEVAAVIDTGVPISDIKHEE